MRSAAAWLLVLAAGIARADGGTIRIREDAGAFRVTVFSAPEPLRVGSADLSVLVQSREGGTPVLDAEVAIHLDGPSPQAPIDAIATRAQATNKLLYAAAVALPAAGAWTLHVTVREGPDEVEVSGPLVVEDAMPRAWSYWPYLTLPPAVIALFALREWRMRTRDRR